MITPRGNDRELMTIYGSNRMLSDTIYSALYLHRFRLSSSPVSIGRVFLQRATSQLPISRIFSWDRIFPTCWSKICTRKFYYSDCKSPHHKPVFILFKWVLNFSGILKLFHRAFGLKSLTGEIDSYSSIAQTQDGHRVSDFINDTYAWLVMGRFQRQSFWIFLTLFQACDKLASTRETSCIKSGSLLQN